MKKQNPRWNEIKIRTPEETLAEFINAGLSPRYKPGSAHTLDNDLLVAKPRNPFHLIWSRNGIRNRPPYTPFVPQDFRKV